MTYPFFRRVVCAAVLSTLFGGVLPAHAGNDFGVRAEIDAEMKLSRRWNMDFSAGFRGTDKVRHFARYDFTWGLEYKPVKYLKLGAGYTLVRHHSATEAAVNFTNSGKQNGYNIDHSFWRNKNRFFVNVTGSMKAARFKFSLRERFQYTESRPAEYVRTRLRSPLSATQLPGYTGPVYHYGSEVFASSEDVDRIKSQKQEYYLRSRLQVSYNIRHCPLSPFVSVELSNNLKDGFALDKERVQVGVDWALSKRHGLSFAYLFQNGHDDDDEGSLHALCVGYNFSF